MRCGSEANPTEQALFFIAYQRDPRTGFVQVQRNLASDALNGFVEHGSSALFACPPGVVDEDDWWGRPLRRKSLTQPVDAPAPADHPAGIVLRRQW